MTNGRGCARAPPTRRARGQLRRRPPLLSEGGAGFREPPPPAPSQSPPPPPPPLQRTRGSPCPPQPAAALARVQTRLPLEPTCTCSNTRVRAHANPPARGHTCWSTLHACACSCVLTKARVRTVDTCSLTDSPTTHLCMWSRKHTHPCGLLQPCPAYTPMCRDTQGHGHTHSGTTRCCLCPCQRPRATKGFIQILGMIQAKLATSVVYATN